MTKIAIENFDPPARTLQSHIAVSARSQGKSTFRVDGIIERRQSHRNITKRPNSRASVKRAGFARRKANTRSLALASGQRRRNYRRARHPRRLTESQQDGQSIVASDIPAR